MTKSSRAGAAGGDIADIAPTPIDAPFSIEILPGGEHLARWRRVCQPLAITHIKAGGPLRRYDR